MKARHMFSGLQYLDLSCNNIGNDGIPILARSDLVSLVWFFLCLGIWESDQALLPQEGEKHDCERCISQEGGVTSCDQHIKSCSCSDKIFKALSYALLTELYGEAIVSNNITDNLLQLQSALFPFLINKLTLILSYFSQLTKRKLQTFKSHSGW